MRRTLALLIALVIPLTDVPIAEADGKKGRTSRSPPYLSKTLRLGKSKAQVEKTHRLNCMPVHFDAQWCHVPAPKKQALSVAGYTVWFLAGRAVKIDVNFHKDYKGNPDKFVRPFILSLGPPDTNTTIPVTFGPYRGQYLRSTVWQNVGGVACTLSSRANSPVGNAASFAVQFISASDGETLFTKLLRWEASGLPMPN